MIYGDTQFTFENGVSGGSGTESDPFIIEGKRILSYDTVAIYIANTTKHCIIRNNYIELGKLSSIMSNNIRLIIKHKLTKFFCFFKSTFP